MSERITHGLAGVHIGCAEDESGPTGCTYIGFQEGASCSALILGGAIAGRDLSGASLADGWAEIDGLLFVGGSSWGLRAADGVVDALTEENGGSRDFETIPSLPTVALYDFENRTDPQVVPNAALGRKAFENATRHEVKIGKVGAGRNLTVGSYLDDKDASPGGQGAATAKLGAANILVVSVVNASGNVLDFEGNIAAGKNVDLVHALTNGKKGTGSGNTVLTAVITDAALTRPQLMRLATIVDAGLARVIQPFHTDFDGDVVFACSTARRRLARGRSVSDLGVVAAECAQRAVLLGVGHGA